MALKPCCQRRSPKLGKEADSFALLSSVQFAQLTGINCGPLRPHADHGKLNQRPLCPESLIPRFLTAYESKLEQAPPGRFRRAVLIAYLGPFLWSGVYPLMVNAMPRSAPNERVVVPWPVCLAAYFAVPVLVTWAASFAIPGGWKVKVFLASLAAAVTCGWFFGLETPLLEKAWRRGF